MSFGVDVKALLSEKVSDRVHEYENVPRIGTRYKAPLIGFVDTDNPLFDEFSFRRVCVHPKKIFRPGFTVIVYFVPFEDAIAESNRGGDTVSDAWNRAAGESIMLVAHINGAIREALQELGYYETSGTNLPGDWDEELCRPEWSHKHAAFLAGLGSFGTAGAFYTEKGFAGCFGSVITTLKLDPSKEWTTEELYDGDRICQNIDAAIYSSGSEKAPLCPAGAISKDGVDRFVCMEFCKKQGHPAPLPDVCGKCFFI